MNESTSVKIDELVQRFRLGISIFKHPQQVFEQHYFAADGDGLVGVATGPLRQFPEQGVVDNVGADEVAAARLADVDRVEVLVGGGAVRGVGAGLVVGVGGVGGGNNGASAAAGAAELE